MDDKTRGDIESLLRERDGYVARGRADRVAQVDAVLAALGHHIDPPVETRKPAPAASVKAKR